MNNGIITANIMVISEFYFEAIIIFTLSSVCVHYHILNLEDSSLGACS